MIIPPLLCEQAAATVLRALLSQNIGAAHAAIEHCVQTAATHTEVGPDDSVEMLELDPHTEGALLSGGCTTIRSIALLMGTTEMRMWGIGAVRRAEVEAALRRVGLELRGTKPVDNVA